MRLLKTKLISEPGALEIKEFDDISIPKYAILSHRWSNDEPTLQDVERGTTAKEGFKKVQQSCDMAKRDGIDYIWIDTCCIDKRSSSELSEAINSMYLWYFKAYRCYAYLADVPSNAFGESEWFTRGWTLQELLAPADLVFLDANWNFLGTKEGLQKEISSCTGIPISILSGDEDLETCSIAQRMSWAAKRSTKRIEDLAYCLLGIFAINMPLLYGEGERAFIRLQEEIMRVSDDHSLFAWESPDNRGGLLATSPAAFKGSGDIIQFSHADGFHNTLTISSRGVHLDFQLIGRGAQRLGLALLRCKEGRRPNNQIAIYLTDLNGTMEIFQRVRSQELERIDLDKMRSSLYLMRKACIQTGRIVPTRRQKKETNVFKLYESFDHDKLEYFFNLAQPEALLHAAQEGLQDDVWLMLTRRDIDINSKGWDGRSPLFHAVKNGHEAVVKMLLAQDADISLEDKYGYTPLLLATEKGHEKIVKLLLERGAGMMMMFRESNQIWRELDEILRDKEGNTHRLIKEIQKACSESYDQIDLPVFVWAAKHHQEAVIKLLLDEGTEVDLKKKYGPILLRWAARGGHKAVAEWLIDKDVDVDSKSIVVFGDENVQTPLLLAIRHKHIDIIELLLQKGADTNVRDGSKRTPLSFAFEHGNNNALKLLLEKKANPNARYEDWAPLTDAVEKQDTSRIMLLLKYGATIDAKDYIGRTALSFAAEFGHPDTIELLIGKGADIDARDHGGRTPLSIAAAHGHINTVKLLVENGASIDAKDDDGLTPLSYATLYGCLDNVKLLLEKGADIEAEVGDGRTLLSWAATDHQDQDIVELLLELGAEIEAEDDNGRTPLSWAATGQQNQDTVQLLLDKGARIEAKDIYGRTPLLWASAQNSSTEAQDNNGRTPLAWAAENGYENIIDLLLEEGAKIEAKDNYG